MVVLERQMEREREREVERERERLYSERGKCCPDPVMLMCEVGL